MLRCLMKMMHKAVSLSIFLNNDFTRELQEKQNKTLGHIVSSIISRMNEYMLRLRELCKVI